MNGKSGAKIESAGPNSVVKTGGGTDLIGQAVLMRHLGEDVCPRIIDFSSSMILMEKLLEPEGEILRSPGVWLEKIRDLLEEHVWSREPIFFDHAWWWQVGFYIRKNCRGVDEFLFRELYPDHEEAEWTLTHGDATLANVMFRGEQLLLIDAIQARPHVPSLMEIDIARLLQSAAGWEHAIDSKWTRPSFELWNSEIRNWSPGLYAKALFWASYNATRTRLGAACPLSVRWASIWEARFGELCRLAMKR